MGRSNHWHGSFTHSARAGGRPPRERLAAFGGLCLTAGLLVASAPLAAAQDAQVPTPPDAPVAESLCGPPDFQNVEQYDGALGPSIPFVDRHQSAVGQIQWNADLAARYGDPGNVSGVRWCTGTLISQNLFLTAGHCFDVKANDGAGWDFPIDDATGVEITPQVAAQNMHINFNYQFAPRGGLRPVTEVAVVALREYRRGGLDYAVLQLAGNPGGRFGTTAISRRIPNLDELLTIIQHPQGIPKVVEAGDYDGIETTGILAGYMRYTDLDTQGGSSGSGVLDSAGRIVGVHTNAGCTATGGANHGVLMDDLVPQSPLLANVLYTFGHGQLHYWPMQNGIRQGGINIHSPVGQAWNFKGMGDVNGDGTDDVIWQHKNGQVHYWPMQGGVRQGGIHIHSPVGVSWNLEGIGDVDGDGTDDIVWQHKNGQVHYWRMLNGVRQAGIHVAAPVGAAWNLEDVGDVDGDGTDDIVWQHKNGQVHYWRMLGGVRQAGLNIHSPVGVAWNLRGVGDVDQNGTDDIVWQHRNGQVHYWPMQNGVRQGGIHIHSPVGAQWRLGGVGDVNGDGTDDIIWQLGTDGTEDIVWQHQNGQVHMWDIARGVRQSGTNIHTPVGGAWTLIDTGDLDGDGNDDVVWQHQNGQVHYWPIERGLRTAGINIGSPVGGAWTAVGVGDLNGDGTDDIVWQHQNGQVHYWTMEHGARVRGDDVGTPVGSDWTIAGIGDLDGDRTDDIVWQHQNGQVHYWQIERGTRVAGRNVHTPVGASWTLANVGDVNGDGTSDVVWQHQNGQVHYWPIERGQRVGGIHIHTPVGPSWSLVGLGSMR